MHSLHVFIFISQKYNKMSTDSHFMTDTMWLYYDHLTCNSAICDKHSWHRSHSYLHLFRRSFGFFSSRKEKRAEEKYLGFWKEGNNDYPHGNKVVSVAFSSVCTWTQRGEKHSDLLKAEVILNELIKTGCCQNIRSSPACFVISWTRTPPVAPCLWGEHEGGSLCFYFEITAVEL